MIEYYKLSLFLTKFIKYSIVGKWKIFVRNWYIAWVEWILICRIYCKIYYPFRIFLLSSRNLSSFYHSLTIRYRSFKMFQNEVGTVHWMQWYLDWKFFLKFLNIPNILTCQQAFCHPTHWNENLFYNEKIISNGLPVCLKICCWANADTNYKFPAYKL